MVAMANPFDYLVHNQAQWTAAAPKYAESGRLQWAAPVSWGIWSVPETQLHLLPEVAARDVLELGCGTGYVSSWLARRGARAVGLDPTWAQLQSARSFQKEFDIEFPLIAAAAEASPFTDESFDVIISEYGASIWSDPYLWIPEAARLLRPGGELIFLVNGTLLILCEFDDYEIAATSEMKRDYFGMHRLEWPDEEGIEFHLGYGDMIRLLRANGFEVEDLVEVRPPEGSTTTYPMVDLEWARRWPCEEVWKARKTASRPSPSGG
jgi:SAM-dependent methyltransferase